ncbi:hypothetical protein NDU88_004780 [Pleurodeles waltl]|uniref:Secreted protein n=1 Tax=Pleurodeles waltl TaxID=8319 RepID=A0AAV7UG81_PLEWA|nr:hypothetical protein NDU88_004780 [Pleurodeles waltl]
MPSISSRACERPSPHWARSLLSFPFGVRAAEEPSPTRATLCRGPGPKRLAGRHSVGPQGSWQAPSPVRGASTCSPDARESSTEGNWAY